MADVIENVQNQSSYLTLYNAQRFCRKSLEKNIANGEFLKIEQVYPLASFQEISFDFRSRSSHIYTWKCSLKFLTFK